MTHDDRWSDDEIVDRPRRGRGVLAGAFVLVVIAGLYVAAAMYFGDRVPSDTRVGGVAIGGLTPDEAHDIARLGVRITRAADEQLGFHHPTNPDWRHFSFCLFAGPVSRDGRELTSSAAVAIRPGKVDRSPTGTAAVS